MSGEPLSKAIEIAGVAATEDRDSQGEVLKLSGVDISQMTQSGTFNVDHKQGLENVVGRITEAKKIMKREDASTPLQMRYWDQVKRPFLFVKGLVFDGPGHPTAQAVSTIIKESEANGIPVGVRASVEGKVTRRNAMDKSILENAVVKNVALTLTPANRNTMIQSVKDSLYKSVMAQCSIMGNEVARAADTLMKNMGVEPVDAIGAGGYFEFLSKEDGEKFWVTEKGHVLDEHPDYSRAWAWTQGEPEHLIHVHGNRISGSDKVLSDPGHPAMRALAGRLEGRHPMSQITVVTNGGDRWQGQLGNWHRGRLSKALTAGYDSGTSAPQNLTGGAALIGNSFATKKIANTGAYGDRKKLFKMVLEEVIRTTKESGISSDRVVGLAIEAMKEIDRS